MLLSCASERSGNPVGTKMNVGQRKLLMAGLVGAFVVQTALVYTDDTRSRFEPLSELAMRGRTIWHQRNCYTCHQLYGALGITTANPSAISQIGVRRQRLAML